MSEVGFHDGEREVQARAGTRRQADRLVGMLSHQDLEGAEEFLATQDFAVLSARDRTGTLWTSPLLAPAGFLDGQDNILHIRTVPAKGDPLAGLGTGQPVGLLAIDFANRSRLRINGTLVHASPRRLRVIVDQAFGNCPKYIHQRTLEPGDPAADAGRPAAISSDALTASEARVVDGAVTFFLGTSHPSRGVDASHRGGPPGFVRRQDGTLWWPDYPGNNMFNSLGNLAVDPVASLLFVDFATGETLHLSGTAETEWLEPGTPGDDGQTGRIVRFSPHLIVQARPLSIREADSSPYRRNPSLTD